MRRVLAFSIFFVSVWSFCQSPQSVRIMCYNVENLFDIQDDTLTNDSEYLPGGMRGWNYTRYQQKLSHIAQVVAAVGEWSSPALIGLCEIENDNCLKTLTTYSPLKALNYKYIHYESPDARGVDVGLLYKPNSFTPISSRPIRVNFPTGKTTRDILYACGQLPNKDTIHVFVNHFPSRLGGELESEPSRLLVAGLLRTCVDSVLSIDSTALIIIMGDFNDYPDNKSIQTVLGAVSVPTNNFRNTQLYNLTYPLHVKGEIGSYKHDGQWGMLDQIIVSGSFLNQSKRSVIKTDGAHVFDAQWLLEESKIIGNQPYRTYVGMKFHGGYSDHLPVYMDILLSTNSDTKE